MYTDPDRDLTQAEAFLDLLTGALAAGARLEGLLDRWAPAPPTAPATATTPTADDDPVLDALVGLLALSHAVRDLLSDLPVGTATPAPDARRLTGSLLR